MPRTKEGFQQMRDDSRQNILNEAAKVFAEKGLAGTKISDIAESAGISQGLLYRYYSDKEAVFTAILETGIANITGLSDEIRNRQDSPREKLLGLTRYFLNGMADDTVYYRIFSQALAVPGSIRKAIGELEKLRDTILGLIIAGQEAGEFGEGDPEKLTLLYLASLYGLAAGMGFFSESLKNILPDAETVLNILKP